MYILFYIFYVLFFHWHFLGQRGTEGRGEKIQIGCERERERYKGGLWTEKEREKERNIENDREKIETATRRV